MTMGEFRVRTAAIGNDVDVFVQVADPQNGGSISRRAAGTFSIRPVPGDGNEALVITAAPSEPHPDRGES